MHPLIKKAQKDVDELEKLSASGKDVIMTIAKPLLGLLAIAGASGFGAYYTAKKNREEHQEDLKNSMSSIWDREPQFKKSPAAFVENLDYWHEPFRVDSQAKFFLSCLQPQFF